MHQFFLRTLPLLFFTTGIIQNPIWGQVNQTPNDSTRIELKIKYKYPGKAIGPGPLIHVIKARKEKEAASRVLIAALQTHNYSILNLKNGVSELKPKNQYETDIIQLNDEVITKHNDTNPNIKLPSNYYYGSKLLFFYDYNAKDQEILFNIQFILYYKGAGGPWSAFQGQYSGLYFTNQLVNTIQQKMNELYPKK